jgi:hypothetical protein
VSYKKILENLKNLPEGERFLAMNMYYFFNSDGKRECGCALGKGLPDLFKNRDPFEKTPSGMLNELDIESFLISVGVGVLEGMTPGEAIMLQRMNDRYRYDGSDDEPENSLINRHARYLFTVNWLEKTGKSNEP